MSGFTAATLLQMSFPSEWATFRNGLSHLIDGYVQHGRTACGILLDEGRVFNFYIEAEPGRQICSQCVKSWYWKETRGTE